MILKTIPVPEPILDDIKERCFFVGGGFIAKAIFFFN